jgi:hypothetical protein
MGFPSALPSRLRPHVSEKTDSPPSTTTPSSPVVDPTTTDHYSEAATETSQLSNEVLKKATRLRKGFALSAAFAYLVSLVFLILVGVLLILSPLQ